MPDAQIALPLLRLGRLELDPGLRALRPAAAAPDLVATATVEVPESASERQYAWEVAWGDAVRDAGQRGAERRTAEALAAGAGQAPADGSRVVVAAHGEVLLARWLPPGSAAASVRVGPLPHLLPAAAAAARRPAYVVLLADRDGAAVLAHPAGDQHPATRFGVGHRPGLQPDPHPDRPPAQHHGERHLTDREPLTGGERNAEFIAGQVAEAAASVGAHVILGAGDPHILGAVSGHLPSSLGPITTIASSGPVSHGSDDQLRPALAAALDAITAEAIGAVGDLVASSAPVRGIEAVAEQLAEQQVAVLLVAADIGRDGDGPGYRIGTRATELLVGDSGPGTEVPLEDGLVWAALHQDALILALPDRAGSLAGQPAAALLRGTAGS